MIINVLKRDNSIEKFNEQKIKNVIIKTFNKNGIENKEVISSVFEDVINYLNLYNEETINVEEVQDIVQNSIWENGYKEIAFKFIEYRFSKKEKREMMSGIYKAVENVCKVTDRENANVGNGPSSKMLQIAETTSKDFYEKYIISETTRKAIKDNKIYPHDHSWASIGTTTCTFIPLRKLLENGFDTGHGFIRKPKRIRTAAQLSCIILQANQCDQHGGQAYSNFDQALAPSIKREYEFQLMNEVNTLIKLGLIKDIKNEEVSFIENLSKESIQSYDDMCDVIYSEEERRDKEYNEIKNKYKEIIKSLPGELKQKIEELAWENTERETLQAMEATIHNLNSMHSRAGAQVPFSSVNIGTDTSREGRLVVKSLLLAYEKGLGKGEQPLFPNICFKVKSKVNYEEDTPNFDLLLLALRVSSKRLFPTFSFQDSTINKDFPEDVPTMGCRTRISWNRHMPLSEQSCEGRGNLSFTTINLPNISLECKFEKEHKYNYLNEFDNLSKEFSIYIPKEYQDNDLTKVFFLKLNEYVNIAIEQLVERFKYQCNFKKVDFPFLMNGTWMNSETLNDNDKLYDMLKHGTLGIGFIGLAETLKALVGKHHGEDETALKLGIEIIKFLDLKSKIASETHNLNFAVIATPAEGLTGKFVSKDKNIYGAVEGITDKEWYTNSFHIPVEYNINIFKKIKIEGSFSKYCQGGSITYVELNESPLGNIKGYYKIIKSMYESDVVYGAINFPCDRCKDCGEFGVIEDECNVCGSKNISRIRRITGYLAEKDNFNYAKKKETENRVVHMKI